MPSPRFSGPQCFIVDAATTIAAPFAEPLA